MLRFPSVGCYGRSRQRQRARIRVFCVATTFYGAAYAVTCQLKQHEEL